MISYRVIFVITCTCFMMYYYWKMLQFDTKNTNITSFTERTSENIIQKLGNTDQNENKLSNLVQKSLDYEVRVLNEPKSNDDMNGISKDLKYILLWTGPDYVPLSYFKEGQTSFIKNNCPVTNCYVTANNSFLKDITEFHAIAFNGRTMVSSHLPRKRSPHQKYIYFNMESSDNYRISDEKFDGFFNWTATYKLNSDIPFPYIAIKNKQGDSVGPKTNMQWLQNFSEVDGRLTARLSSTKTKAAAWFVSNCKPQSYRSQLVNELKNFLQIFRLTVDVYGECGELKCPRNETSKCNAMLERDYFFYMSLENSFADDYVTEKLLTAVQNNVVPITLGGANYSRFLPPGSYLDANNLSVEKLAISIYNIMKNSKLYLSFFRWKSQYSYANPSTTENVCAVCSALNNKEKFESKSVYDQFRKWWNPVKSNIK